jgi:hypothetical protein
MKLQNERLQKVVDAAVAWRGPNEECRPVGQELGRAVEVYLMQTEKRNDPVKNCSFHVEPCPKDWDGSPKGCWDQHPLTREICQLKPDGHTTHKRDDASGKQLLCWVRS